MTNRDDFTSKTKDILSKRVGLTCSNPDCKRITSGPNEAPNKVTSIGVAAHITAAAPGGPRYDESMDSSSRKDINNAIWLCVNCSTLIDRDPINYTVDVLLNWKNSTEAAIYSALTGSTTSSNIVPFIEADLIYDFKSRMSNGFSPKNFIYYEEPFDANTDFYKYWTLTWKFNITLHNNSETPCYNVKVIDTSNLLSHLQDLGRVNHIKPFHSITIEAIFTKEFEGTSKEANILLSEYIPIELNNETLNIIYYDNQRVEHKTIVTLSTTNIIVNTKI